MPNTKSKSDLLSTHHNSQIFPKSNSIIQTVSLQEECTVALCSTRKAVFGSYICIGIFLQAGKKSISSCTWATACLIKSRERTCGVRGKQIHVITLSTLGIKKMCMEGSRRLQSSNFTITQKGLC